MLFQSKSSDSNLEELWPSPLSGITSTKNLLFLPHCSRSFDPLVAAGDGVVFLGGLGLEPEEWLWLELADCKKELQPKLQLAVRLTTNTIRSLKQLDKFLDTDNMHGLRVTWKAIHLYKLGIRMTNYLDWLEITFTQEL